MVAFQKSLSNLTALANEWDIPKAMLQKSCTKLSQKSKFIITLEIWNGMFNKSILTGHINHVKPFPGKKGKKKEKRLSVIFIFFLMRF